MTKMMDFTKTNSNGKWDSLKDSIINQDEEDIFSNITPFWIDFLKKDKNLKKNSFIVWNIGGRGSGKTGIVFMISDIILKDNNKRAVQFWQADQGLIDNIKKVCPDDMKDRFETIFKLRDIKFNSIFVIDEGLLGANAKEALRTEMKNLIKFISKSRHLNIIAIINSVSYGILFQFRDTIDVLIYKRLPRAFLKNNEAKDFMFRDYPKEIMRLKNWEGLLVSSYDSLRKQGLISWKLKDYCPWFNDDISMYQKNVNPDVDYDEQKQLQLEHERLVKKILKKVGMRFDVRYGYRKMRMWLYTNHLDDYYDNKKHLKTIFELYLHKIETGGIIGVVEEGFEDFTERLRAKTLAYNFEVINDDAVAEYFKIEKDRLYKERNLKIYFNRHRKTESELQRMFKIKSVMDIIKHVGAIIRRSKGLIFEKRYTEFLYNTKMFTEIRHDGSAGKPDIVAHLIDNEKYAVVFSLKSVNPKSSVYFKVSDFAPEIEESLFLKNSEYIVHMLIVVLDNTTNNVYYYPYDYKNPIDVPVHRIIA